MKTIYIFCFFSIISFGQAPTIEWQKTYGGSIQDYGNDAKQTSDGGYILIGDALSTDGDFSDAIGYSTNARIIKTDAYGNILWQKDIGGSEYDSAHKVITTIDGGYLVACNTISNNGQVYGNHGLIDIWIVKLNSQGDILWSKTYGCNNYDGVSSIIQTSDGNYVFAGNSTAINGDVTINHGYNDLWVVKINNTGSIIWQKSYGGSGYDYANDVRQTTDGGYILCGASTSSNFDVTFNQGSYDYWVVKLNTNGDLVWQKTFGGSLHDEAHSILQTNDGGYIVIGQSVSSNGDINDHQGGIDCWIIKLNNVGSIIWKKSYGGFQNESAFQIIKSDDNGYIIASDTNSTNGFFASNNGLSDFYIFKINSNGVIIWQTIFGGSEYDYPKSIQSTNDGGLILSGTSASNDGQVTNNHGLEDFWLVKLSLGQLSNNLFSKNQVKLSPNPTKEQLNIKMENNSFIDKINITNTLGKTVLLLTDNSYNINIENLASGIYFVEVFSEEKKYIAKFIKQ
ncbi:T9SS type A sorting domain-containing protein [Flavobacterium sp.]|uniref:T9SS type A sorting domain-containing protein n=2 Tax=Flavobacterium sp. TaxID=239 RepID=UPI004048113B